MIASTLPPPPTVAQSNTRVTGGGTGTFEADLDGDGEIDDSQFGLSVGNESMGQEGQVLTYFFPSSA